MDPFWGAGQIVVAARVPARGTCAEFQAEGDGLVRVMTPRDLRAKGKSYKNFLQTTDAEVRALLEREEREQTLKIV